MAKKANGKIPKRVYVAWNHDDPNEPFLVVEDDYSKLGELNVKKLVGVFELVNTLEVYGQICAASAGTVVQRAKSS